MPKAEYASARRSRALIKQAFLAELAERELDAITVSDVVRRAGVNRSTFYAHYSNIPGLLSDFEGEVIDRLHEVLEAAEFPAVFQEPEPFLAMVSDALVANADLYRTLLQARGSEAFLVELGDLFVRHLGTSTHVPEAIRSSPMFAIRAAHFAGGMTSLYTRWLLGRLPYDLDEVNAQVAVLVRATSLDVTGGGPTAGAGRAEVGRGGVSAAGH